jgi:hypothetical protein
VILLEYTGKIDHGKHMDSSTYIDVCHYDFFGFGKEVYGNGRDGDMFKDMGRNNSISPKNRTQPFTSAIEDNQMWYFRASKNIDPGTKAHRHINICHPKAPPAPDPVKIDPNHSPLGGETTSTPVKLDQNHSPFGGETTSTPVSKVSSNLYSDTVDPYPSSKRLSATVDRNEYKQLFQVQVVLAEMDIRTNNASTYHYSKELIASRILGYDLINENLNHVDEKIKQWKQWNII